VDFRNNRERLWTLKPRLLRFRNGIHGAVTGGAVLRRGLVEQYGLAADQLGQLVTIRTTHVLMSSSQRELGPFLMIEKRGLPLHRVMALHAAGDAALAKLLAMNVFVAIFT